MTSDVSHEIADLNDAPEDRDKRLAHRIGALYADDPPLRAAEPKSAVGERARRPGLRLPQVLETLLEGYADRPALGWRARTSSTDPATGRTTSHCCPGSTPSAITTCGPTCGRSPRRGARCGHPVSTGRLRRDHRFRQPAVLHRRLGVCVTWAWSSVPLQHSAAASRLQPIIAEVEPRVLAAGAAYLDVAVDAALGITSLRRLVVFDYQAEVDEHAESSGARASEAESPPVWR